MDEVKLPSGRTLKIGLADFSDAKAVFKIFCEDMKPLRIEGANQVMQLWKDLFVTAISSDKLEKAVMKCALKSTIDDESMKADSFEAADHRQDWLPALIAVWRSALDPFSKPLLQEYGPLLEAMGQESLTKSTTTSSSPSTDS